MYARLTVKWSNTLFGCIAAAMAPIPIILFLWGPKIRSRSKFAKMIEQWREHQTSADDVADGKKALPQVTEDDDSADALSKKSCDKKRETV
jgi:hypothetical protein